MRKLRTDFSSGNVFFALRDISAKPMVKPLFIFIIYSLMKDIYGNYVCL